MRKVKGILPKKQSNYNPIKNLKGYAHPAKLPNDSKIGAASTTKRTTRRKIRKMKTV